MTSAALTPGGYLTLRREAAGLTLAQAARLYAYNPLGHAAAEQLLAEAEGDVARLGEGVLERLGRVFPFSATIYLQLVAGYGPPSLCRSCGCSWYDPCEEAGHGCAWADETATICTACVAKQSAAA